MEEEWEEHCSSHLESIVSKRCAPLIYCNTLVRPGFCPFCLGDSKLSSFSRWNSWTREDKLRSHLGSHITASCWPSQCPHPLCGLHFNDELSFFYHLKDVHSLDMNRGKRKWQYEKCKSDLFVHCVADTVLLKRKREQLDGDSHESDSSPHSLSEVSVTVVASDGDPQDLPELTHSGVTSPPGVDELCFINDMSPNEAFQEREQYDHMLRGSRDLPETTSNKYKTPLQDEGSRSPLCCSAKSVCQGIDNGGMHSHTATSGDICLSVKEDSHLSYSIDQNTVRPSNIPFKANMPRITLRIRQPEPRPKPKVLLRLSQPKRICTSKNRSSR